MKELSSTALVLNDYQKAALEPLRRLTHEPIREKPKERVFCSNCEHYCRDTSLDWGCHHGCALYTYELNTKVNVHIMNGYCDTINKNNDCEGHTVRTTFPSFGRKIFDFFLDKEV